MPTLVFRLWLGRGFRLSLVVGIVAAAWQSWTVFYHYDEERQGWVETRLLYECASRLKDDDLKRRVTEFGTVNVKGLCAFDGENHWVSLSEVTDVRNGVMKFETISEPFNKVRTISAGIFGFLGTMFATLAILSGIRLVQWVWGRAAN
jgi:hypothetical protein